MKLWRDYNQRLLKLHKKHPFPLIEFHDDASLLCEKLQELISGLDLPVKHHALTFFEDDLRTKLNPEIVIPKDVRRLYDELTERAM